MQHKGEIVEKAVRQSGYSITKLSKKLGKTARWMYYMFESSNVSIDYILEIGEIIHYDFSDEIKELKKYKAGIKPLEVNKHEPKLKSKQETPEYWKNKYLELLEKYNQVLLKLTEKRKTKSVKK
jgi:CRISPR/Cas system-associated exonuclease Cas4 (RecB family)